MGYMTRPKLIRDGLRFSAARSDRGIAYEQWILAVDTRATAYQLTQSSAKAIAAHHFGRNPSLSLFDLLVCAI